MDLRRKTLNISGSGQLRWVILLLAVAVILPTVCLLWFMSQAVKNVQIVTKQRLMKVYQEKLAESAEKACDSWKQEFSSLDEKITSKKPFEVFGCLQDCLYYDGAIIYDKTGARIYPLFSTDVNTIPELSDTFAEAWQAEFEVEDYSKAVILYEQLTKSDNTYIRFVAILGMARSYAKLGRSRKLVSYYDKKRELENAIGNCMRLAFNNEDERCDIPTLTLLANARLLMIELSDQRLRLSANKKEYFESLIWDTYHQLYKLLFKENEAGSFLPSDQAIFVARRILDIYKQHPFLQRHPDNVNFGAKMDEPGIQRRIAAEELSIRMVEHLPAATILSDWPKHQFQSIRKGEESIYAVRHAAEDGNIVLFCKERFINWFRSFEEMFADSDATYRIIDDSGRFVTGVTQPEGKPFGAALVGEHFPGWKTELYFKHGDIFEEAVRKQRATYIWAGTLMIVLMLVAGVFASQAVGRQMKLNRLKNDFIATVSHELKTPLSSMRVLADTLLEGNYKDQKQATEYLQLICKENKRLSGLIDNFLTFSRMERNKQAFEMVKTSPAAIAKAATEAVKTKFDKPRCEFKVNIRDKLPDVLADHDAMVTVLVNLLDNSYKYSNDEKRIELGVYSDDDSVCFRISDNGIGLSQRAIKKIFKRFYQVDRSLTRQAEGCGLGLSIAMFIVDAHKGSISVDSIPGERSTFTVRLPVAN